MTVIMMIVMMMMRALLWVNFMLKSKSLLSKKKHYKHELTNLTKKFDSVKNNFAMLVKSNEKLVSDLKSSNSLEDQFKKANDEN